MLLANCEAPTVRVTVRQKKNNDMLTFIVWPFQKNGCGNTFGLLDALLSCVCASIVSMFMFTFFCMHYCMTINICIYSNIMLSDLHHQDIMTWYYVKRCIQSSGLLAFRVLLFEFQHPEIGVAMQRMRPLFISYMCEWMHLLLSGRLVSCDMT